MGSSAGGAHAAIKQQKAQLASLIARLRTQRQACQVTYLFLLLLSASRHQPGKGRAAACLWGGGLGCTHGDRPCHDGVNNAVGCSAETGLTTVCLMCACMV